MNHNCKSKKHKADFTDPNSTNYQEEIRNKAMQKTPYAKSDGPKEPDHL